MWKRRQRKERAIMNNQQSNEGALIATKLLNRLATSELEAAKLEVQIDDLKQKVSQLSNTNQQLQSENNKLKQNSKGDK